MNEQLGLGLIASIYTIVVLVLGSGLAIREKSATHKAVAQLAATQRRTETLRVAYQQWAELFARTLWLFVNNDTIHSTDTRAEAKDALSRFHKFQGEP